MSYIAYREVDCCTKDINWMEHLFETKEEAKEFIITNLKSGDWLYDSYDYPILVNDDHIVVIEEDITGPKVYLYFKIELIETYKKEEKNNE